MGDINGWPPEWLQGGVTPLAADVWRGVEGQHQVATLKLTESIPEQEILDELLVASKPPLPQDARGLHPFVATPFRYRSPHGSRFRRAYEPGLWGGAEELPAACAEVGYWRRRFVSDSDGLSTLQVVSEHTFFLARLEGRAIDLTGPPWSGARARWTNPTDYGACQQLAEAARGTGVQWIRHESVRLSGGHCAIVLDPRAISLPEPLEQQTWVFKTSKSQVLMVHEQERISLQFDADGRRI